MVLQRGPRSANLWGYVIDCSPVSVDFNGETYTANITKGNTCEYSEGNAES